MRSGGLEQSRVRTVSAAVSRPASEGARGSGQSPGINYRGDDLQATPTQLTISSQKIAEHSQKRDRVERFFHERTNAAALHIRVLEIVAVTGIHDDRQIRPNARPMARC